GPAGAPERRGGARPGEARPGGARHPPYVASDSPSTAAKSEARRTASAGSSAAVLIRTPAGDDSRKRAPAATHQPYDRSPLTTADSSRTGTHTFIPLAPYASMPRVPSSRSSAVRRRAYVSPARATRARVPS